MSHNLVFCTEKDFKSFIRPLNRRGSKRRVCIVWKNKHIDSWDEGCEEEMKRILPQWNLVSSELIFSALPFKPWYLRLLKVLNDQTSLEEILLEGSSNFSFILKVFPKGRFKNVEVDFSVFYQNDTETMVKFALLAQGNFCLRFEHFRHGRPKDKPFDKLLFPFLRALEPIETKPRLSFRFRLVQPDDYFISFPVVPADTLGDMLIIVQDLARAFGIYNKIIVSELDICAKIKPGVSYLAELLTPLLVAAKSMKCLKLTFRPDRSVRNRFSYQEEEHDKFEKLKTAFLDLRKLEQIRLYFELGDSFDNVDPNWNNLLDCLLPAPDRNSSVTDINIEADVMLLDRLPDRLMPFLAGEEDNPPDEYYSALGICWSKCISKVIATCVSIKKVKFKLGFHTQYQRTLAAADQIDRHLKPLICERISRGASEDMRQALMKNTSLETIHLSVRIHTTKNMSECLKVETKDILLRNQWLRIVKRLVDEQKNSVPKIDEFKAAAAAELVVKVQASGAKSTVVYHGQGDTIQDHHGLVSVKGAAAYKQGLLMKLCKTSQPNSSQQCPPSIAALYQFVHTIVVPKLCEDAKTKLYDICGDDN